MELFGRKNRNWFTEPGYSDDVRPLCPSWVVQTETADRENHEGSRPGVTRLEIGMCLMLTSFKALPLTFAITSYGVLARDPELRLTQTYRITKGVTPCKPQESLGGGVMFCAHRGNACGVHWIPPPGFRSALMNYDGYPFQAEELGVQGSNEPGAVGGWATAFRASCFRNIRCEMPLL